MSYLLDFLKFGLGAAYVGYKVKTTVPSSATLRSTYTDRNCTVANDNPTVLGSNGDAIMYLKQECDIYFLNSADVVQWSLPNVGFEARDYLQGYLVVAPTGTTFNTYAGTVTPAPAALEDGLSVIVIPDVDSVGTLGTVTFTGTGSEGAAQFSGRYTGTTQSTYTVYIDSNATPDTLKWRKDSGAWTELVNVTGVPQFLAEGLYVTIPQLTGNTLGDYWTIAVNKAVTFNLASFGDDRVYQDIAGTLTVLDNKSFTQGVPAKIIRSETLNCWILSNPPITAENQVQGITRARKIAAYTIVAADKGKEISCSGTYALTLDPAADLGAGFFVYARNSGSGVVTLTADGTEKIYGPNISPAGASTFIIAAGASVLLTGDATDFHILDSGGVPTGAVMPFGAAAAPAGYLLCNGAAVSRTTYAGLFAVCGTTYGVGDGATTFNVPDMQGYFPFGKAAAGTGNTLGGTFGNIDHTHSVPALTIPSLSLTAGLSIADVGAAGNYLASTTASSTGTGTTGTGNPPGLVFNFIIKY